MIQIDVYVLVDADGNYAVGADTDQIAERYAEETGNDDGISKRIIKLVVNVPEPAPIVAVVNVPEETQTANVTVQS